MVTVGLGIGLATSAAAAAASAPATSLFTSANLSRTFVHVKNCSMLKPDHETIV